jgi:hypothetical protein
MLFSAVVDALQWIMQVSVVEHYINDFVSMSKAGT